VGFIGLYPPSGGWEALLPYKCEDCGWRVGAGGFRVLFYPKGKMKEPWFLCDSCAVKRGFTPPADNKIESAKIPQGKVNTLPKEASSVLESDT